MNKLLRPRDKILLGLAILGDAYFKIAEPISIQLSKLKGTLPEDYKISNFYSCLYRLLSTQDIKKIVKEGKVYYQLTNFGSKKLTRNFPLINLQSSKWDGLWRIVIFDIKEKNRTARNLLRQKLFSLGFGKWQESVYITPFNVAKDVSQFLKSQGFRDQVCVLVAKHLFAGDVKKLVSNIWQLEILNKQYEALIDNWKYAKKRFDNDKLAIEAKRCYEQSLEIIIKDPYLPIELLPANWWGIDARKIIKELSQYL